MCVSTTVSNGKTITGAQLNLRIERHLITSTTQMILKKIIYHNHTYIFDLNLDLLSFCLKCIRHTPQLSVTVSYDKIVNESFSDLRSVIQPKIPHSVRPIYQAVSYMQVFGNQFVPNLSVIDLLFCEGPRAGSLLLASRNQGLNK